MTSPGGRSGREVGRVYIKAVPDASGFRRDLQNELETIEKSLKVTIPVGFDVDTAGLRTQLQALEKSRVTIPVDFGDGTEIERLRARIEALDNAEVHIPVELGDGSEIERLRARVAQLDGQKIRLSISLRNAAKVIAQLEAVDAAVRKLNGRAIHIKIDADGAAAAVTQLAGVTAATVGAQTATKTFGAASASTYAGLAGQVGHLATLIAQVGAVSLGLAVAGAGVTAAWGAAATAVAAVPGALMLAAAPIGAVITGLDGIKAAAKAIEPEFDRMRQTISATFERGLTPLFERLARDLFPALTTGMQGTADALVNVAGRITDVVTKGAGLVHIQTAFEGVNKAIVDMGPGLEATVRGLLQVGAQSGVFDALTRAVNTFGAEFQASVIDLIGSGTLQRAMAGLGEMLAQLSRGFVQLVDNGIRVFAAAAPGVNAFLADLTGFFERFNWEALGASVGNVFRGLGETLRGVDTSVIREIEASFQRLGDLFRNQTFQQDLQAMISGIPAAIDQIRLLAQDFAQLGADMANALTAFNTVDQQFRNFTDSLVQAAESLGTRLGIGKGTAIGEWLQNVDDDIDRWLGILPPKTEQLGTETGEGATRGLRSSGGQFGQTAQDTFNQVEPAAQAGMAPVPGAIEQGMSPAAQALATAVGQLPPVVQEGLAGLEAPAAAGMASVATGVTTGMAQVTEAMRAGLVSMGEQVTIGFQAMGAQANAGMTQLSSGIASAMPRITELFRASIAGWGEQVTIGFQSIGAQANAGMTLLSSGIASALPRITELFRAAIVGWGEQVTTGFQAIGAQANAGMTLVSSGIAAGFAQVNATVTAGLAQVTQTFAAAFAGPLLAAVQTGMTNVAAAVTAGFGQVASAATNGMINVSTAVSSGFAQTVAGVQASMAQLTGVVTSGFAQMGAAAVNGMSMFQSSIVSGFAMVANAATSGMAQVTAAVQAGFSTLVGVVTSGMAQVSASFSAGWANVSAGLSASLTQMTNLTRAAMQQMVSAVQQSMQQFAQAVQQGGQQAVSALQQTVSQMINVLNGAVGQFRAAGANMGAALAEGLRSQLGAVRAAADALAAEAARAAAARAQIASPSRVFMRLGDQMAQGLAVGLDQGAHEVERAGSRLVDALAVVAGQAQDEWKFTTDDAWWSDFNGRVNTSLRELDVPVGAAAGTGAINQVFNMAPGIDVREFADEVQFALRRARRGGRYAR